MKLHKGAEATALDPLFSENGGRTKHPVYVALTEMEVGDIMEVPFDEWTNKAGLSTAIHNYSRRNKEMLEKGMAFHTRKSLDIWYIKRVK